MPTQILINAAYYENRLAVVDDGNLLEFHIERPAEKGLVGNIYKGRVVRVLPGMQAAFVDIGLERTGFLYVDDVHISSTEVEGRIDADRSPCQRFSLTSPDKEEGGDEPVGSRQASPAINELLTEGQEILVQISKEPIGSKGARLTCHITLPCRNLVFMPMTDHIGISKKIEDELVRERLRDKIEKLRPQGAGFIVRTVAEHISDEELEADMEFLLLLWDDIMGTAAQARVPALVYRDLDMIRRSVRDLFTDEIDELVIDSAAIHVQLLTFVKTFAPHLEAKIRLYTGEAPIFEAAGIEVDISRALEKKVWLRSGGYIIIESTEALTVIDVNTGRYVGRNDLAETIFKTNLEAAREIAYQLRLRNIGGIIIVDFIDMASEEHREELLAAFQEQLKKDRSRVNILKLSEFGLVQMTRKRSCESLVQMLCEPCFYCGGDGFIKSQRSICYEIFRKISRDARRAGGGNVIIKVHPRVADMLLKEEAANVEQLEQEVGKRLTIIPVPQLHQKRYEIIWKE